MERLAFAPYARAFAAPYRYGALTLHERRGCVLRARVGNRLAYAEASPLPGHSRESLAEVLSFLESSSLASVRESKLASLRWGLRCLELSPSFPHPVESNALLTWNEPELTTARFERAEREGYRVFKLKLLVEALEGQLAFLRAHAGDGIRFRLDANRAFSAEAAARLFAALAELPAGVIDYVEEPLANWDDPALATSPVPLAADESAADPATWDARYPPTVCLVKPMVQGSLAPPSPLPKRVVVTSTLEAEPGRRALLTALAQDLPGEIAGVATGSLLEPNFLPDRARHEGWPPISGAEQAWLAGLPWREVRA